MNFLQNLFNIKMKPFIKITLAPIKRRRRKYIIIFE